MKFDIGLFPWPPETLRDYIHYGKLIDEAGVFDVM